MQDASFFVVISDKDGSESFSDDGLLFNVEQLACGVIFIPEIILFNSSFCVSNSSLTS